MNPYLTSSEFNDLCTPGNPYAKFPDANGHTLPNGDIQLVMARRNLEGGPREDTFTHTTWRGVFGVKGEINADWTYDSSLTYSVVRLTDNHTNDISSRLVQDALLAVKDPATGQIVCRSRNSGCIPWNIFNPAGPSAANAISYFSAPGQLQGSGSEQIWTTFVNGDLTSAGVKLPTADDGLKLVLGSEYRQETVNYSPDEEIATGDLIGNRASATAAGFRVGGVHGSALATGAQHDRIQVLDLEGGYRYSSYTSGFNTNTWKVGLAWSPIKDVRIRGSYNVAVRAPNAAELGKPTYVGLDGGTDLCAGKSAAPYAQCAFTGLSAAQYPAPKSPASQYNGQIGGNPNLQPETGKTEAVGLVFTPTSCRASAPRSTGLTSRSRTSFLPMVPTSSSLSASPPAAPSGARRTPLPINRASIATRLGRCGRAQRAT
jgi:outer membrane receptor protein involved in Fe transport